VGDIDGDGLVNLAGQYTQVVDGASGNGVRVFFDAPPVDGAIVADATNGFNIVDGQAISSFVTALAPAGDVNGDGIGDILIGAPNTARDGESVDGMVYVVFGKSDPATVDLGALDAGFAIYGAPGPPVPLGLGVALLAVDDVNGDGLGDFLISDPQQGDVYLIFGKRDSQPLRLPDLEGGTRGRVVLHLKQRDCDTWFGSALSRAGDLDADGRQDFLIGAPGARVVQGCSIGPGVAYVLFGAALDAPAPL
jgi:hypothetical protein